jgi:hypothetical protein
LTGDHLVHAPQIKAVKAASVLQAPLLGGLFIGILSALPVVSLGNCCCLWIVSGGVLAAYLDQQRDPLPITTSRGAFAGFVAGIIGAFVWLVVSMGLDVLLAPLRQMVEGEMVRIAREAPPDVRALLESMNASSPLRYTLNFFLLLCAGGIFSTLGGVLGAAFFRNDVPPALGGPIEPPPLPPI